ncbi:RNA-binding domain-containing protein [Oribacterium parvum]|uniref:RNA-binding domain-containing protein n=1 Tax=Oribacterium parvum TaxID=1501329 RepID=UPI0028E67466|nr:RNA-binding domain-containing protein [Oribacterium parvum]
MGLPTSIETLLTGNVVEGARIEFKTSWMPEASLKTICAFANDIDNWGGGYIVLGVKEKNGRPVFPVEGIPVSQVDGMMKDLLNKCNLIQPRYLPVVAPIEYQGKTLIVIWAPGGDVRPYSSPDNFTYLKAKAVASKERTYFIRKMSSTVKPSQNELNELYSLANKVPFDDRVNHQAEMTDLNINLIRQYLSAVGSSMVKDLDSRPLEKICEDMGICNTMPEYRKPKNVGLMFFSDEPEKFFPYAQIDVVAFPKGLGGDEIDEQTFKGPLDQQLKDALRYISNNYIQRKIIKHPDRAEADHIYNYPYAALEEALANAVYHKAYDVREPIEVRIEEDKIEIVSYPGPVYSVTREQLKDYRVSNRRYRNRRIGEFLKELHLTEGRNTGFKKILDAIKRNGSPLPEFETDKEHSYFISRIFVHPDFISGMEEDKRIDETEVINPEKGKTEVINEVINPEKAKTEVINEVINPEKGKTEVINEVINPKKAKTEVINEVINPKKAKNDGINDGIKSKLSNISDNKREKIEELLLIITGNPCAEIGSIAIQLGVSRSTAERYLAELRRMEIVKREGSNKNGKWRIL